MLAYRYLGWTLVAYGLGLLVAPIESNFELAPAGLWLWVASALMSLLGLYAASQWRPAQAPEPAALPAFSLVTASQRLNLLAGFGLLCTVIDRYVLRGAPLDFDFFAARDALEATAPTPIGLVGALLGALACFALGLAVTRHTVGEPLTRRDALASLAIFTVYVAISIGVGSRSTLLVSVISTLFCVLWVRRAVGQPLQARYWLSALAILVGVALVSAALMLERLQLMDLDPFVSIEFSGYAYTVRPSSDALDWLTRHAESAPLLVAGFSLLQYVFHGLFEFSLFAREPFVENTHGAVTFWLPLKLLSVVGVTVGSVDFESISGWREGIFTTFLGPLYLDFGLLLPLAAFLLFLALGLPANRLRADRLALLPYCSVLCALCVLFPIVNLLDSASGAYPLVASLLIPWLGRPPRQDHPPRPV